MYHAKYKRLGMDMALKRYVKERLQPHSMEQIAREIAIHSQMQHASIAPVLLERFWTTTPGISI